MRRLFNILIGALAMLAVALLSAFITLRLAIHGREVEVPDLSGQTIPEAIDKATQSRLNLTVENRFYSTTTPAGRVLSQLPAPGSKVRRDWTVRVSESLGPQRVSVPNVVGQSERTAAVNIRRLALDLGTVAYIPAPGPAGIVLTQSPTPAAAGIDGPRISLLVSEPETGPRRRPADATDTGQTTDQATATQTTPNGQTIPGQPTNQLPGQPASGTNPPQSAAASTNQTAYPASQPNPQTTGTASAADTAFVMPNLIGLSLSSASSRVAAMGLHIASVDTQNAPIRRPTPIPSIQSPSPITGIGSGPIKPPAPIAPMAPVTLANTVIAQSPMAGHRVTKNDPIHITLSH